MDNKKLILIIEDNKPIRKLFSTLLKKSGYETADFDNANDTLEWLKNNSPKLIIMDILLPDMNGTELIHEVKKIDHIKDVPVVAVTGFATGNDREKYLNEGFDHYLSKPINTTTFVDEIKSIIK